MIEARRTPAPVLVHTPVEVLYRIENTRYIVYSLHLDSEWPGSMLSIVLWQFQMFSRLVQSPGLKSGHDSRFMPRRERYRT